MKKKHAVILLWAMLCATLTGCLFRSPSELYKLPEVSSGYAMLESAIRSVRVGLEAATGSNTEVAVILSGDNTATIQLQDLDGDGERESAITFIRVPGEEKPLQIYVFRQVGERFQITGMVEGVGNAIYSIDFVDLNGKGCKELVVNWQLSTGVYQLGAYTLDELDMPLNPEDSDNVKPVTPADRESVMATELLLTSCSTASDGNNVSSGFQLVDLDRDTRMEIALVKLDTGGLGSQLAVYGWHEGAFVCVDSVSLSSGMVSLNRMRSNYLKGELFVPALYVTGTLPDGSRVIDVVAYQGDKLTNLSLDPDAGVSRERLQGYTDVAPTDVDGDGVVELPTPMPLPSYGEKPASNFWLIDWGRYDEKGQRSHVMTTYHNVADSWYLEIPAAWKDKITISRRDQISGQREVVFSLWRGEETEPKPFLSIYRLTGGNRQIQSTSGGRFVLREEENVIYAARFYDSGWDCGLDQNDLIQSFNTIHSSWYYD